MNFIEILKETVAGEMLITFFLSMVPVLELRGAIPIGVGLGLSPHTAMLVSVIGNMIPVPFIILFVRRVFAWLRRNFPRVNGAITALETKAHLKGQTVKRYKYLGLCIFVAIPLPGTGAWTGTLAASILDMDFVPTIVAVMLGVLLAGVIMMTASVVGFSLV